MNIILLCKRNEVTAGIATYLIQRGHSIQREDANLSAQELSDYDIGISYNYRHILKKEQIEAVKWGIINFHSGYLPDQRGAMPNVWSLVYGGKGGVTCHWIDEGIDTGPIIAQKRVYAKSIDTGETFYKTLCNEVEKLFYQSWPAIESDLTFGYTPPSLPQDPDAGETFRVKDVKTIDDVTSNRSVIDILRARTFPPYDGCYFIDENGRKVFVSVQLRYADAA